MKLATALFVLLSFAGCATLKNTPQQDYVWEIGRICDGRVAFWKMREVRADGSSVIHGASNAPPGWADYQDCMREEQARRPYQQWLREQTAGAAK